MKYIDQENPRFTYYIRETLNGFAIQVLNVARDERYPLTKQIAAQNDLTVPEGIDFNASNRETVEASLLAIAKANGLIEIE